ncbi:flagellar hook-basal body complex protein FliE [Salinicola avicenniae]|uniref:flagellar hook-basal body complex protein FliE n=1 Tax=Salinicola avicenniae TaxID=2916836 RepID=UPI0020740830|nr:MULTISPECIES: flagellar hook-basal body complex protein FliE [unclassified Salinicola]
MSTPGIQAALQQMQALSTQASGQASPTSVAEGPGSFAGELQASIGRINQMKVAAADQAKAFQAGDPDVALNDVMVDMQKASVAFEMGLQTRNRLVTAYKDVMGMQI